MVEKIFCSNTSCKKYLIPLKRKEYRIINKKEGKYLCKTCRNIIKIDYEVREILEKYELDIKNNDDIRKLIEILVKEKNIDLCILYKKFISSGDYYVKLIWKKINCETEEIFNKYINYFREKFNRKKKFPETLKLWAFLNNIHDLNEFPKCIECENNLTSFIDIFNGFSEHCPICCRTSQQKTKRQKETFKKKYGVNWVSQSKEWKEKVRKSFEEKYGGVGLESEIIKKKYLETIKEKCNVSNLKDYINNVVVPKREKTYLENIGKKNNKQLKIKNYDKYYDVEFLKEKFEISEGIFDYEKMANYFGITKKTCWKHLKKIGLYQRKFGTSNFEHDVKKYLIEELKIPEKDIKQNDREFLKRYEIDLLLKKYGIGIECDGIYWHSIHKNQKKSERELKLNRYRKKIMSLSKRVNLLFIQDIHWFHPIKEDIWKSIIRIKLGKCNKKIYARNINIIEIEPHYLKNFFNVNHLDGYVNGGKIGLCLIDDNFDIISAMIIGKPRYRNDIEWEILRFATKLNTICVGGFSKLLKYFENKYRPESLITYADLSISNGEMYRSLGFVQEKINEPEGVAFKIKWNNRKYFIVEKEIPMITFRYKNKKWLQNVINNFDEHKSIKDNLIDNGWLIYYRVGSFSFVKYY